MHSSSLSCSSIMVVVTTVDMIAFQPLCLCLQPHPKRSPGFLDPGQTALLSFRKILCTAWYKIIPAQTPSRNDWGLIAIGLSRSSRWKELFLLLYILEGKMIEKHSLPFTYFFPPNFTILFYFFIISILFNPCPLFFNLFYQLIFKKMLSSIYLALYQLVISWSSI